MTRCSNLSDLIININLYESRKKRGLIIETYEGEIPHLKSKKFSGQLRSVNIDSISYVDNVNSLDLVYIKNLFNDAANMQISNNQYIFSACKFPSLITLIDYGCVFCKDKIKGPMYKLEQLLLNTGYEKLECIHSFSAYHNKTVLYLDFEEKTENYFDNDIIPILYVDVTTKDYCSELFFDYGSGLIRADDREILLKKLLKYRDYRFEKNIVSMIKKCSWKKNSIGSYSYCGKDITSDMRKLKLAGVHLFTNTHKKIDFVNFDNVNFSWGIDWFDLKGDIKIGDVKITTSDFSNFLGKKEIWTEYNQDVIFLPQILRKLGEKTIYKDEGHIKIAKNDIFVALEAINSFKGKDEYDLNNLLRYKDIQLQLPEYLENTLRNYQKIGVKWLLSLRANGFGGCLADDMGLGKTLQVISYLSEKSQKQTNALIVAPKTLIENWSREFAKFTPDITTYIYHGNTRNLSDALNCRAIITTFGTILNDTEQLSEHKFDNLIIDEAQYIKNSRTKAYRAVKAINATTRIIMTGTPLENNIQEYWGLMKIANPTELSYKAVMSGLSMDQAIDKVKRLTSPFLLRRFKKDVLDDLPEKDIQTIYCSFDEAQRNLYNTVLESIRHEIIRKPNRFDVKSNSIVLSGLMYLQEICCHPKLIPKELNKEMCFESVKLDQLLLMLDELYASGHKIVIFSKYTRMLKIISKELNKKNFNVFYLDGGTRERQKVVDNFEKSYEGIFLISLKAGGVGLNLVSADTAIIYDPWWNPAVEKQAEDRLYRIGQKNKVTIFKLITTNTIEEKVRCLQEVKNDLFDDVIEGNSAPLNITIEDILNLLY